MVDIEWQETITKTTQTAGKEPVGHQKPYAESIPGYEILTIWEPYTGYAIEDTMHSHIIYHYVRWRRKIKKVSILSFDPPVC